ncbi:hypothetical protein A3715_10445 [Oleiphilus sp. HI0009]|nr:hypothetical protein A3715_10445 [Oleiphilus sp. HI0009]
MATVYIINADNYGTVEEAKEDGAVYSVELGLAETDVRKTEKHLKTILSTIKACGRCISGSDLQFKGFVADKNSSGYVSIENTLNNDQGGK